jgi:hypothetical protein
MLVRRKREIRDDVLYGREVAISKSQGLIRDRTYCTRLYSREKISGMLRAAGFAAIDVRTDFVSHKEHADYGLMTNRMIVIGEKRNTPG